MVGCNARRPQKPPAGSIIWVWRRACDHLLVLGALDSGWDRALAHDAESQTALDPPIAYLPGWPQLITASPVAALAQAGWFGKPVTGRHEWFGRSRRLRCCRGPRGVEPFNKA